MIASRGMTAMKETSDGNAGPAIINFTPFPGAPRVRLGEFAFRDLEIDALLRALHSYVPGDKFWCRDYIRTELGKPLYDRGAIALRQDAIEELLNDNDLYETASAVKAACERFKYRRIYNGGMEGGSGAWRDSLQRLENAAQMVELAHALIRVGSPVSSRLAEVGRFSNLLEADDDFRQVRRFMEDIYLPRRLGDAVYTVRRLIEQAATRQEGSQKEMEESARVIAESAEAVIKGNYLAIEDEPKTARLIVNIAKLYRGHSGLLWRRVDRDGDLAEVAESLVDGLNLLIYARLPVVRPGDLDHELALYLAAAALCRHWIKQGVPVAKPAVMAQEERRCDIRAGRNITLLEEHPADTVPNDISWDRNENLFVITGPNNGGKTTYIRMAGQLIWMIQTGLLLPAQAAAASLIDGIFTSFAGGDDSSRGEGHYAAELSRIARILLSAGDPVSPYSLVLMDEFATGTDHEEAARITGVVFSHLSELAPATFFTTHRSEAADKVERGGLQGGVNLAPEILFAGGSAEFTYRIRRHARESSYGHLQAERLGITPERLRAVIEEEIARCLYPASDTRLNSDALGQRGRGDND